MVTCKQCRVVQPGNPLEAATDKPPWGVCSSYSLSEMDMDKWCSGRTWTSLPRDRLSHMLIADALCLGVLWSKMQFAVRLFQQKSEEIV